MKTISGQIISTKEVSLSKATKILSKFVNADNGASQAISAYLHRTSAAFNELNQFHKELKPSSSHQKHESHRTENADHDNEKSSQTICRRSQEPNSDASIGPHARNEGGSEKHKNKKKRQEVDFRDHDDLTVEFGHGKDEVKVPTDTQNAIEPSRIQGRESEDHTGVEEGKKHKKDKKKKDKEGKFSSSKSEIENLEVKSAMGSRHQKERQKKLDHTMMGENGGLVDSQETQIKKKKSGAVTDNGLFDEEAKMLQKKKRKNENEEDRSGYVSNKKLKRKHDGDSY